MSIEEWKWDEPLLNTIEQTQIQKEKKFMRIIVIETINILQNFPETPPDSLVYVIGPYSKPLDDNQVYLHPPGIPSDMNLWDRQLTVSPEQFDLGWRILLDYIRFYWLDTNVVEFRTPCWNEYANWFMSQRTSANPKYYIESCDFLEKGLSTGKKSKDIYYRVGATHSGRKVVFRKEGRHLVLESQEEFPLYLKEVKFPSIPNWLDQNELVSEQSKWQEWLALSPTPFVTPPERLWELWVERGGKNLGNSLGQQPSINWTTSIHVSNLLGFGNPPHFWDWSTMTRSGYGMIVGTNTAGKSSWVDVWAFGFWGQTARTRPRGVLRHGSSSGWVEITWASLSGFEGKLRREIQRYDASDIYKTKLYLYYRKSGETEWLEYEGRHMRGLTDIKSPQKQIQMDLEEWIGSFDTTRETSLLGVDGLNEIWQRSSHEWNKILTKYLWIGRNQEPNQSSIQPQLEDDENQLKHFKLGFPRVKLAQFMRDWMLSEGYIFLQTSSASFISSPDDISTVLSRSIYAFQREMNEIERSKETALERTEEKEFTRLWEWMKVGLMRQWTQTLKDIWNQRWGDGRISIQYDVDKGVKLQWFPLGGEIGTDLGMACRWERMMIMEGWRLLVYFMVSQSGTPIMADVWLDEEWDGVDDSHGMELMRTFGGWHGAHIIISHQEHWKRKISYTLNMTPNYENNNAS